MQFLKVFKVYEYFYVIDKIISSLFSDPEVIMKASALPHPSSFRLWPKISKYQINNPDKLILINIIHKISK